MTELVTIASPAKLLPVEDSLGPSAHRLTVSAGAARALLGLATSKGADTEVLIRRSGIPMEQLEDQDNRIPLANYMQLLRAGRELSGDAALALHLGETIDLAEYSIVGLINSTVETLVEAMAQLNRYGRLVMEYDGPPDRFRLEGVRGGLWMIDGREDPNTFFELTESTFARLICGPRQFGVTQSALAVHVTHPAPPYRDEYERIFGAPVTFESHWNAILLDEKWLTHRISRQPRYVFGILSRHAEALLEALERSTSTRANVERALMSVLHTGDAGLGRTARSLGLSPRTLSRRLREEGVTFEQVLDDLRRRLALHYLRGKKVSVNQTAYLVGFSGAPAFSRAFKRWTGDRPRAVARAMGLEEDAGR